MNTVIYKYDVPVPSFGSNSSNIKMPKGARILSAAFRPGDNGNMVVLNIWVAVDTDPYIDIVKRCFYILPTGKETFYDIDQLNFVATVFHEEIVLHIFDMGEY